MHELAHLLPDPSPRLVAAYREIQHTRMAGLPFVHAALEVEAIAFAPWEAAWLGVMLTPWFMNLMLLPYDPLRWVPLAVGDKRTHRFPAGRYSFVGGDDAAIGNYQSCSLFSPVDAFADHTTARLVATLAREALFDPAHAADADNLAGGPELTPTRRPAPMAGLEAKLEAPLGRRDFLRGRFAGRAHDDRG